jgi:hypothetical protein
MIIPTAGQAEVTSALALPSRAARVSLLKASRNCVTSVTDSAYLRVSDRRRASICGLTTPPTSPIGDRHFMAGDLQGELLAGFGAHAARVGRCTRDVKLPGQPQRAHFFAWYTPVRAASPPQVAHPVNSGFFVSMPTRRPFSVPT